MGKDASADLEPGIGNRGFQIPNPKFEILLAALPYSKLEPKSSSVFLSTLAMNSFFPAV
jgi:hypothetical protein